MIILEDNTFSSLKHRLVKDDDVVEYITIFDEIFFTLRNRDGDLLAISHVKKTHAFVEFAPTKEQAQVMLSKGILPTDKNVGVYLAASIEAAREIMKKNTYNLVLYIWEDKILEHYKRPDEYFI